MRKRILIFSYILIIIILVSTLAILINNQQSKSAEADCVPIISLVKLCYCLHCKEGSGHHSPGEKCSSDGVMTAASDDDAAGQGCQMRVSIVDKSMPCP